MKTFAQKFTLFAVLAFATTQATTTVDFAPLYKSAQEAFVKAATTVKPYVTVETVAITALLSFVVYAALTDTTPAIQEEAKPVKTDGFYSPFAADEAAAKQAAIDAAIAHEAICAKEREEAAERYYDYQ